jgi:septal ring factor EnvC (AmiA/AmiB activator)
MVCLLVAGSCQVSAAPDDTGDKTQELNRIRGRISTLNQELDSAKDQQSDLHSELQELEQEVGRLARRLRVIAGSLKRQRARLDDLQEQRQAQEKKLNLHRHALARQVRAAYAMGRQERLKILLNQQDPAIVSRVLVYYDYLNKARAERLELIQSLLQRIDKIETEVAQEEQRLQELQAKELEQQARLDKVRQARKGVIASLAGQILDKGKELEGLKKDERQLQSLMERLRDEQLVAPAETATEHKPFKALKGRLPWPSTGALVARFGMEKRGGLRWDGVLISAPEGREVKAVHHGRVAFADWLRGFGLLLIIDHGDGYMSLYGHNQSLFKEAGDWVEQGEPVALVGNSGGRLDSGVYFGIRYQGRPVNPKLWCKKTKGNRIGMRTKTIRRAVSESLS